MSRGIAIPPSLFTPSIRAKFQALYTKLGIRAKPKFWKSGRNAGKVRVQGIEALPFTKEELIEHVFSQIGSGTIQCPYCVAIGRPANLLDLSNFVMDHHKPVARGGSWFLENLIAVCDDCNNCKGKLSYAFFIAAMKLAYSTVDTIDRNNFMMCLRSHGATMRARFFPQKKADEKKAFESTAPPPPNRPNPARPMSLGFDKNDW